MIFMVDEFEPAELAILLEEGRNTDVGRQCAFILVCLTDEEDESSPLCLADGINGIVHHPCSGDKILETVRVSQRIKNQAANSRLRDSVSLMLSMAINEIDRMASDKSQGKRSIPISAQVKSACEVFHRYDEEQKDVYFDTLFEVFENIPPPRKVSEQVDSSKEPTSIEEHMATVQAIMKALS